MTLPFIMSITTFLITEAVHHCWHISRTPLLGIKCVAKLHTLTTQLVTFGLITSSITVLPTLPTQLVSFSFVTTSNPVHTYPSNTDS